MDFALPAIGGMIGGLPGMVAGTALSMVLPNAGDLMADRRRQARSIQQMSIPGIVSGPDMARSTGRGFSLGAASRLDRSIREMSVSDFSFNQDDYRGFLKSGMQYDLMDYSGDSSQYATTIKKMRDNIKFLAEVMENKDLQALFKDMKRLQTMGASIESVKGIGSMESMFARAAGMGHEEMVSAYGQQGALQYTQRGMTGYQGSLQAMSHAAAITMAQRSNLITPGELSRAGGRSGLTQRLTDSSAQIGQQVQSMILPGLMKDDGTLDAQAAKDFAAGKLSMDEMMRRTQDAFSSPERYIKFDRNRSNLMEDFQEQLGVTGIKMAENKLATNLGRKILGEDASVQEVLFAGYKQLGVDRSAAEFRAKQESDSEYWEDLQTQHEVTLRTEERARQQEYKHETRWYNRVSRKIRELKHDFGNKLFGRREQEKAWDAQQKEDEVAGVYNVEDRGAKEAIALAVGEDMDIDSLLEGSSLWDDEGAPVGHPLRGGVGGSKAYQRKNNSKEFAFKKKFLMAGDMDMESKQAVLDANGFQHSDIAAAVKGLKSKDVRIDTIARRLAKQTGIDVATAKERLKSDPSLLQYVFSVAKQGTAGEQLRKSVEIDAREVSEEIAKSYRDAIEAHYTKAYDSAYEFTGGNIQDTDFILGLAAKTEDHEGVDVAMSAYALSSMISQSDFDRAGPELTKKMKESRRRVAMGMGMSEDEAKWIQEGDTQVLKDFLINKKGMSPEEADELIRRGTKRSISDDPMAHVMKHGSYEDQLHSTTKIMTESGMKAHATGVQSALERTFADATGEVPDKDKMKEILSSPEKVGELLGKVEKGSDAHTTLLGVLKAQGGADVETEISKGLNVIEYGRGEEKPPDQQYGFTAGMVTGDDKKSVNTFMNELIAPSKSKGEYPIYTKSVNEDQVFNNIMNSGGIGTDSIKSYVGEGGDSKTRESLDLLNESTRQTNKVMTAVEATLKSLIEEFQKAGFRMPVLGGRTN
jgi:hypothetical protein